MAPYATVKNYFWATNPAYVMLHNGTNVAKIQYTNVYPTPLAYAYDFPIFQMNNNNCTFNLGTATDLSLTASWGVCNLVLKNSTLNYWSIISSYISSAYWTLWIYAKNSGNINIYMYNDNTNSANSYIMISGILKNIWSTRIAASDSEYITLYHFKNSTYTIPNNSLNAAQLKYTAPY